MKAAAKMGIFRISFDVVLIAVLSLVLATHYLRVFSAGLDNAVLIAVIVVGLLPVLKSSYNSVRERKISVDLLAAIALIASLIAREWPSAVFINLMLASARILDEFTASRAKKAIESLLKLRPDTVKVKRGEDFVEEKTENLRVGDAIAIGAGGRIPIDGIVESGAASIDQSSLTGESLPLPKERGDSVLSSTLVLTGSLVIRTEKVGKDTTLEKIIELVKAAEKGKTRITGIADVFATWYIVGTVLLALAVIYFTRDIKLLLSLLLIACADDIAVAIPLAFLASVAHAARRGIIVKGGNFLETLTKVKMLVVDKTGTLTKGKLAIERVRPFGTYGEKDVLKYAAMAGFFSRHPASKAVIEYAIRHDISFERPKEFEEIPGKGGTATLNGHTAVVGRATFLKELGVSISNDELKEMDRLKDEGYTVTPVAYGENLIGYITFADEVRPESIEAVKQLKKLGVERIVMLTGDNKKVAEKIASSIGITEFQANVLPEDKVEYIAKSVNKKFKVAMAGDGINDAAALARSDVGIAMGVIGSDTAIEAADIALMQDDIRKIAEAIKIGKQTMAVAYQNFAIWAVVSVIGFVLIFGRYIGPSGAAAFNFLTDFFPLLNAMRLFRMRR
ncbi:MAG: hypothetical protein A2633_00795 [Candidatus Sungbacteria bacterium RIFCSPHIGHO2_01_FULL_47_32]|uniref:P-type ATPase A domain-containing protein n=1 Tax=Candidatus Sungbacteria bacterium RIFCSPHIGHO2_01_FULL_47_32 TaxID=1802264 RepID=A0A1G2K3G6_9BACT|nr:MAG: Copper-translocating P-type ATPase [Parcubacteria group bacterium GW2011_GWA2_47_10]OGZ93964.1 MAG: hypothetical protein A2633_00795 [Candidatus Sungbacteria bacterium RIFCSPHIGHO2_01_FULL_47_32]